MYGADVQGVADTLLRQQASTIAIAASPQGDGKKPTRTPCVLDGATGTLDPTFDAHALLVKHWALAWWEDWVCPDALQLAFEGAKDNFADGNAN